MIASTAVYAALASALSSARRTASNPGMYAPDTVAMWQLRVQQLLDGAPSGSGFDSGTVLDYERCTESVLVFSTSFHHMDERGAYDGWTDHRVVARASFVYGFVIHVTGTDRNGIKDHISDTFHAWLSSEAPAMVARP